MFIYQYGSRIGLKKYEIFERSSKGGYRLYSEEMKKGFYFKDEWKKETILGKEIEYRYFQDTYYFKNEKDLSRIKYLIESKTMERDIRHLDTTQKRINETNVRLKQLTQEILNED